MGTHRSKHNKGRKPFYKDHRAVSEHLLKRPRCDLGGGMGASWAWTRTWWSDVEMFKLDILCEADAEIEGAADHLGRSPTSIAHRAKDNGIILPPQWVMEINPKWRGPRRPRIIKPKLADPAVHYPYINRPRPEHADLLAINSIIPGGIPENMRADMCQEIALAILEGRTTLDALKAKKANGTYFINKFYHDNYEGGGHTISFDNTKEDWDADAVASSIAAKEWHREQFAERTAAADSLKTFTPPDQFEAAWRDQVGRAQLRAHELGQFLTHDEMAELLDAE